MRRDAAASCRAAALGAAGAAADRSRLLAPCARGSARITRFEIVVSVWSTARALARHGLEGGDAAQVELPVQLLERVRVGEVALVVLDHERHLLERAPVGARALRAAPRSSRGSRRAARAARRPRTRRRRRGRAAACASAPARRPPGTAQHLDARAHAAHLAELDRQHRVGRRSGRAASAPRAARRGGPGAASAWITRRLVRLPAPSHAPVDDARVHLAGVAAPRSSDLPLLLQEAARVRRDRRRHVLALHDASAGPAPGGSSRTSSPSAPGTSGSSTSASFTG